MKRSVFRLVYARILQGLPTLGPPGEVARLARARSPDTGSAADRIVGMHTTLCASQGFLFGLPGLLLLPITLPANLTAAAAIQLHMAASLAALAGLRPEDPAVRDRCVECLFQGLTGTSDNEEEEIAVRTGVKLMERGVRWAVASAVRRVARFSFRRVGLRSVPLVGGIIGGGADGWKSWAVARCARIEFLGEQESDPA